MSHVFHQASEPPATLLSSGGHPGLLSICTAARGHPPEHYRERQGGAGEGENVGNGFSRMSDPNSHRPHRPSPSGPQGGQAGHPQPWRGDGHNQGLHAKARQGPPPDRHHHRGMIRLL